MRRTHRPWLIVMTLALAANACSESPLQPVDSVDLVTALSEMSLGSALPPTLTTIPPASTAVVPSTCAFDSPSQSFVCAPRVVSGLTLNNGFTLLGADGQSLNAFDATTTASVRTTSSLAGTLASGGDVLTVDQHDLMTLSGLLSGLHVLNGLENAHFTGTISGFSVDEAVTMTIAGLQPARGVANRYPTAGTISMTIVDAPSGSVPSTTMVITLTFNGTNKVAVSMSIDGGTPQPCVIDLANDAASTCF